MSEPPSPRAVFVAGSTGATGRTLLRLADGRPLELRPHLRPATAARQTAPDPRAAVVDLEDADALAAAVKGCTTVIQLIGTMRKRFASGDTYETSDIGTTRALVRAAKATGVDHFVLLSSVGAGRPIGAYLKAKATAEALVRDSGLRWTIFRPSAFEGEYHRPIPGARRLTRALGLRRYEPIRLEDLAGAMLYVIEHRLPLNEVLEGDALWQTVDAAHRCGIVRS